MRGRRAGRRLRSRTQHECREIGTGDQGECEGRGDRGKHRHRKGGGSPPGYRRRPEGRHRARIHLHHEDRRGCRCAPDHGHRERRRGREGDGSDRDRRRRCQVLRRRCQGHRRRCGLRDDGKPLRRDRRVTGTGHHDERKALQAVPGDGFARGDERGRLQRPVLPEEGDREDKVRARGRGRRNTLCWKGLGCNLPARRRAQVLDGIHGVCKHPRDAREDPVHQDHECRCRREPPAQHPDNRRSPQLPAIRIMKTSFFQFPGMNRDVIFRVQHI